MQKINSQFFTQQDYHVPSWSGLPSYQFFLEVIKEGASIQQIKISQKQLYLIGKNPQTSDIILENPSISRKHAILQCKNQEQHVYLYDLGSTHGTYVNKKKLPSKVYHKLNVYDSIKFGNSTRQYVLRSYQIQNKNLQQEKQDELTDFQRTLKKESQNSLSKQQMKEKYLDLLENDPYYKSSHSSIGKQFSGKKQQQENGINWGISDEYDVYAYRNQNEYPLESELLRRLPGLDNNILIKIGQYQQKLQKYQQSQSQLRDLANKQQRQYGLQQKQRQKKQKLQKKVIEYAQALQKVQEYLKLHLFGQQNHRNAANQKRQKQIDTYEDDQFYDRTKAKVEKIDLNELKNKVVNNTTQDYWELKNRLQQLIGKKGDYNKQLLQCVCNENTKQQDMDEYEKYMFGVQKKLKQENYRILVQKIQFNNEQMNILRQKLEKIRPEQSQVNIIFKQEQNEQIKKKQIANTVVSNTLSNLQKIIEKKNKVIEEDQEIFRYYQKKVKIQQKYKRTYKQYAQQQPLEQIQIKQQKAEQVKRPMRYNPRNKINNHQKQQQYHDLTKLFK